MSERDLGASSEGLPKLPGDKGPSSEGLPKLPGERGPSDSQLDPLSAGSADDVWDDSDSAIDLPPDEPTDEVRALPAHSSDEWVADDPLISGSRDSSDDELMISAADIGGLPSELGPIPDLSDSDLEGEEEMFAGDSARRSGPLVLVGGPHDASHSGPLPSPTLSERMMTSDGYTVDYSAPPMIHLEGVHKAFGKREILRGVELAIYPGETVCLIGGSGTGKSVSLKHIMRLIDPDQGKIWLDGEDITEAHGDRLQNARTKLGVNFQFGALLNWLTVFENVALPLRENTDMHEEEISQRVMQKLELLSIPHARDLYPTQISGGMVKRAGLARAVVMEESLKVILYDEPTSGLDPISTAVVDDMVNEMKSRLGLTQVIVTHDMTSAYRTADRIAVLYEGKVCQFGTPEEIQNSSVPYVQQFVHGLSSPADAAEKAGKAKREESK